MVTYGVISKLSDPSLKKQFHVFVSLFNILCDIRDMSGSRVYTWDITAFNLKSNFPRNALDYS